MKLVKVCIAMAAFAALLVAPSVVSAVTLTSPTGSAAPVGTWIRGTNVTHARTALTARMTTSAGTIECATATIAGTVTANGGNSVTGEVTSAQFSGKPGVSPHGEVCASPLGDFTVTPNSASNPVIHNGFASLPWCIHWGAEDLFTLTGGSCAGPARPITFKQDFSGGVACAYEKASLVGVYTTHPGDTVMTLSKQNFTEIPATASVFCPNNGELDTAFTLETDNASPQPVYIDK